MDRRQMIHAMFEDYQAGMNQEEIARKYGKHESQVSTLLNSHPDWANRRKRVQPNRRISLETRQAIVDVYLEGYSVANTAKMVGTGRSQVRRTLNEAGIPIRSQSEAQTGKHNGFWKGDEAKNYRYIPCPEHPYANWQGEVAEHRLVMEATLGRYLHPWEVVHHKNKKRADNRPENLQLFSSNAEHLRAELTGHVPQWTEEGKQKILEAIRKPRNLSAEQRSARQELSRQQAVGRSRTLDGRFADGSVRGTDDQASQLFDDPFGTLAEPSATDHTSTAPLPAQQPDHWTPSPTHGTVDPFADAEPPLE